MASPSAGMSKEEIKERLAQMKKQYAQMQKKLEKSDKATRVKRHVSKRIADYKLKQAAGGSPECTTSRTAESQKDKLESTRSPSLPTVNRGRLLSDPEVSRSSTEKRGKRRSVSFALSSQSTPTSSRHDFVQGMETTGGQFGDTPTGVNQMPSVSPQHQLQNIDRGLRGSGDAPNKKLFKNAKLKKQNPAKAVSGVVTISKSVEPAAGEESSHFESGQNYRKHEKDARQVPESLSSPNAKTPPEDTQFDLFADADVQDESQEVMEILSDSASNIKMDAVGASLEAAGSIGPDLKTSGQTAKELPKGAVSAYELNTHQQAVEESVVILDETQMDIFGTQSPKKCTKDKSSLKETSPGETTQNNPSETVQKSPSMLMAKPDNASGISLYVGVIKEKGLSNSHQNVVHSVSDEEGTEDPDVIPSTFPEDTEPVTKQKSSVSIQNVNSDNLDASRAKCRESSPLVEKESNNFQSVSKQIAIDHVGYEESEMKVCDQRTTAKEVDMVQTSVRISTNGEPSQDEDKEHIPAKIENQQTTIHADDPNCANLKSQNNLINSEDNTFQKVPPSPGEKEQTSTQGRRRKKQMSIDNLSVDDVSLKDFVLSQQTNQEGSHTWIDGLMYPAEYYVRKTRSMSGPRSGPRSRTSDNQHSAPLPGQRRPSRGSRGRKGPLSRGDHRPTMSEPVTNSKLKDAEPLHQRVDQPEMDATEKIDLERGDTVTSVEYLQDSARRTCNKFGESEVKDISPPMKMKVLRKPAGNKRRRGRKPLNKKRNSDSEQSVIETAQLSQTSSEIRSQVEIVHYSKSSCDVKNDKHRTEIQNIGGNTESITGTTLLTNNDQYVLLTREDTRIAASPDIKTIPSEPLGTPVEENIETNADGITHECYKHISITQMTNNPLESQFTQTLVPSNFALPHVFGSPGHRTQSLVGLSPGSPTSTAITALCSPTVRQPTSLHDDGGINPVPSFEQDGHRVQNQECIDPQWMSEVYMADVVPELPADDDSEEPHLDNLQEDDTIHPSPQAHERLLSQNLDRNIHLDILPNSQHDPVTKSIDGDVSVMSAADQTVLQDMNDLPEPQGIVPENLSDQQITHCRPHESEQHTSERIPLADLVSNQEPNPSSDPVLPSSAPAMPSSLCSNVNQGSPMADAATGTPPEVAEVPQAQSQCTNSYRDGPEVGPGKEIVGGDLSRRECFQFKGCLEHIVDQSSEVRRIISSILIIDDVPQSLVAVIFTKEIFFWVLRTSEEGQDFQVLCSWRTNKVPEEITLVEFLPNITDGIEAVIGVKEENGCHSVRCIRWDCRKERWKDNMALSSEDTPQKSYTSLCVLQERKVAIAVYKKDAGGSEVLVVWLHSGASEKTDFHMVTLPASKDRINSLAAVQGTAHMILGMTDREALLWHVPSHRLVQVFSLEDQRVNYCIETTAESGLLFLVAYNKLDDTLKDYGEEEPICSLLVLNPRNGRSSKLLSYSAPCFKPGIRIQDVSVCNRNTLAICLTSSHICLWDLYSSQLLLETGQELEKKCTALCLQDTRTLLLGSDGCVNLYERSF